MIISQHSSYCEKVYSQYQQVVEDNPKAEKFIGFIKIKWMRAITTCPVCRVGGTE